MCTPANFVIVDKFSWKLTKVEERDKREYKLKKKVDISGYKWIKVDLKKMKVDEFRLKWLKVDELGANFIKGDDGGWKWMIFIGGRLKG